MLRRADTSVHQRDVPTSEQRDTSLPLQRMLQRAAETPQFLFVTSTNAHVRGAMISCFTRYKCVHADMHSLALHVSMHALVPSEALERVFLQYQRIPRASVFAVSA